LEIVGYFGLGPNQEFHRLLFEEVTTFGWNIREAENGRPIRRVNCPPESSEVEHKVATGVSLIEHVEFVADNLIAVSAAQPTLGAIEGTARRNRHPLRRRSFQS
jgi:hypothetical protein